MKLPYTTMGFLGALIGANLAKVLFLSQTGVDAMDSNHIGEGLGLLLVGGIFYDIINSKLKLQTLPIPAVIILPIATFIIGAFWEVFSFLSAFNITEMTHILSSWWKYGFPIIFFVGMPVMMFTEFIRKKKKFIGLNVTNSKGIIFAFIVSGLMTISLIYIILNYFNLFGW